MGAVVWALSPDPLWGLSPVTSPGFWDDSGLHRGALGPAYAEVPRTDLVNFGPSCWIAAVQGYSIRSDPSSHYSAHERHCPSSFLVGWLRAPRRKSTFFTWKRPFGARRNIIIGRQSSWASRSSLPRTGIPSCTRTILFRPRPGWIFCCRWRSAFKPFCLQPGGTVCNIQSGDTWLDPVPRCPLSRFRTVSEIIQCPRRLWINDHVLGWPRRVLRFNCSNFPVQLWWGPPLSVLLSPDGWPWQRVVW